MNITGDFYLEVGGRKSQVFWFVWGVGRCEKKGLEHFLGKGKKARKAPINECVKIA